MSDDDQGGPMRTLPITPQPGYAVVTPLEGQLGWHTLLADAAPPPTLAGKARVLKAGTHVALGFAWGIVSPAHYSWRGDHIAIVPYEAIRATVKQAMGSQRLPVAVQGPERIVYPDEGALVFEEQPAPPPPPPPPAEAPPPPKREKPTAAKKPERVKPPDDLAYAPPEGEAP